VASAGSYVNHLHLAQDNHAHFITQFLQADLLLTPDQQHQSTQTK